MPRSVNPSNEDRPPYRKASGGGAAAAFDHRLAGVIRAGLSGDAAAMRQLVDRLIRSDPPPTRKRIRDSLALVAAQTETPFIPFRADADPTDVWATYEGPEHLGGESVPVPHTEGGRPTLDVLPASLEVARAVGQIDPPIFASKTETDLARLILEHQNVARLRQAGLNPTKTLLLTGSPGTGKTHTAMWVAQALKRPLLTLDLGQLVAHELGRSARNLQSALRTSSRHEVVLFIDELDALGKARADSADIGEMKRLVNVFLLELDRWPDRNLLVGATNHPDLLDPAVVRRFELQIALPLPDAATRKLMIERFVPAFLNHPPPTNLWELFADLTEGWTGSDIRVVALRAQRAATLEGKLHAEALLEGILARTPPPMKVKERNTLIRMLSRSGWSQRKIASLMGISHPTVGSVLKAKD